MTGAEQGFLLLTSTLGDPARRPLTVAQLRVLASRVKTMSRPKTERDLTEGDLTAIGYGAEYAWHILELLADRELLELYLHRGNRAGCTPITRATEGYPPALKGKLGPETPGCLWAKGDLTLLEGDMVALVGSRDLADRNREFARQVGTEAARQGYTLVSGNARGADQTAQEACLNAGGRVISVVADSLGEHRNRENVLYLSEDGFDHPFSAQRALSRNRVIHCLGQKTFVAQCAAGSGGTWDGTVKNLRGGWSPVFCFDDGSRGAELLSEMGALQIGMEKLSDFRDLRQNQLNFFDQ